MFSCEYCEVFNKTLFKEHHRWLLLCFKYIGNLMTHIQIGKLMTYIFNIILCVSIMYFFIFLHFFRISFAEVIKTC